MKKILICTMFLFSAGIVLAQEQAETPTQNNANENQRIVITMYQINQQVYNRAVRYGDTQTAIEAMYNLVTLFPNNDSLLFNLSYLYFEDQQFFPSIFAARDVLKLNPDNQAAIELLGLGYENVGAREKAVEQYESLYLKSDDPNVLYKIAFLQYDLQRYGESKNNINILMNKPDIDESVLYFQTSEGEQQEIPMKASLYNLIGLIEKDQENIDAAKENFNKALELAPEFELAKQNLEDLG